MCEDELRFWHGVRQITREDVEVLVQVLPEILNCPTSSSGASMDVLAA